eukprot:6795722-Pyramimonas_sp.AAC.2
MAKLNLDAEKTRWKKPSTNGHGVDAGARAPWPEGFPWEEGRQGGGVACEAPGVETRDGFPGYDSAGARDRDDNDGNGAWQ